MIPVTKVPKQSVSATLLEKKKRLREREKNSASKKYPADAKSRFGRVFQTKLSQLLLSNSQTAEQQLQMMYDEALNYYNEHDLNEMWLSDDNEDSEIKPPVSKKMHTDVKVGLIRSKNSGEEKEKGKALTSNISIMSINNAVSASSAGIATGVNASAGTASNLELTDDSDDEQARKTSTPQKTVKRCSICGEGNSGSDANTNILLECDECKNSIHMKCNKFEITMQQALDSRFVFVCSNCRDREAKTERGGITENAVKSSTGKKEEKSITHKLDISAAFATFAAKKKKVSSNSSHQTPLPNSTGISRATNSLQNTSKAFPSFLKK